jgi:multidrug efflux pump subunit AcrA (membrane-fusion protein)
MELAGHSYRQLAEEIGEVLQAAAETAEKMQEDARAEADRIRAAAEAELRTAYAEGRRILDEARMEADMLRAEAEWQTQEVLAQARRQAAERMAGANTRMAEIEQAEARVLDRLAGVGQIVADTLATLRESQRETASMAPEVEVPEIPEYSDDESADQPSAKVYFVEFPPPAPPTPLPEPVVAQSEPVKPQSSPDTEIVLTDDSGASLFNSDRERSEWAPPPEMPTWWIRGNAQG